MSCRPGSSDTADIARVRSTVRPSHGLRFLRSIPDFTLFGRRREQSRGIAARLEQQEELALRDGKCVVTIPIALPLRGGRRSITAGQPDTADHDATLIAALRKAQAMVGRDERGQPVVLTAPKSPDERRLLRLAFFAPDIQQAILAGRQPRSLNLEQLIHRELPLAWLRQREILGFRAPRAHPC
jgi:hypothetical protein